MIPRVLRPVWVACAALAVAGCAGGPLDPHGPIAGAQLTIIIDSRVIMLAIVIPANMASVLCAGWFRESNPRAVYPPEFVYSGRVEILVWSVPTLVILF